MNDWPAHLREFRAKHGYTQRSLAAALTISRRTVEDWEAGKRKPPAYLEKALESLVLNQ